MCSTILENNLENTLFLKNTLMGIQTKLNLNSIASKIAIKYKLENFYNRQILKY